MYVKIKDAIKDAMKAKDSMTRDCLKLVIDKARAIQKEKNPTNAPDIIPNEIMIQAIQREIKQLNQTKDALTGRKNTEMYVQTEHKIALLNAYLPSQMTKEEVEIAVAKILSSGDYANFGMKMKACMVELKGKADNKIIKEVVEAYK